uniref:interleukin 15, like isoform X2 n=1 Tax=Semicossyphus pulcher TaxID=241346 RepID=UPI0037E94A8C
MLTGRRDLATVYLCFFCLLSLTQQPAAQICTRGILKRVKYFQSQAPLTLLDCQLYTPSLDDYENCPRTSIQCFADEVKVLIEEWKTVKDARVFNLNVKLEQLASEINQTNSEECLQCELLQEKKAEDFLEALEKTLTMMNAGSGDR